MLLLLVVTMHNTAPAQLSGFASGTYQFQNNPLYNHEQIGDQVHQGYLELGFKTGHIGIRYVGGIFLFNTFAERNYLDHNLTLLWHSTSATATIPLPEDTSGEDDSEVNSEPLPSETKSSRADWSGFDAIISAKLSARHDKESFKEYDNNAASLEGTVNLGFGDAWHVRVAGEAGYRKYPFIDELSNATGLCRVEVRLGIDQGLSFGVRATGGLKYFTRASYDTARFEAARTYVLVKKQGAGKGGAIITTKEASSKQILANAGVRYTTQITPAGFLRVGWPDGSIEGEILYLYNPDSPARVLARTPGTATINEDIYNDFFSYGGSEANVQFRQTLPAEIQAIILLEHQRKTFGAPALRLDGYEIALSRVDLRTSIEIYMSRWFALSDDIGVDLALSASVLRNESNDEYNDFSAWTIGVSAGLGF
jgi:hypothetical protein